LRFFCSRRRYASYLNGGSADIRQSSVFRGDLIGDYERNDIHIIAVNVDFRW
jgi:hypothetical protein